MATPGTRVGAILSATTDEILLLGFGVYEGDLKCPLGFANPSIRLDSGQQVWGYQCWWGPEEDIKGRISGRKVVPVDLDGNPV